MIVIEVTSTSWNVHGASESMILREVAQVPEDRAEESLLMLANRVAWQLQRRGYEVVVDVADTCTLEHVCGQRYSRAEWLAVPHMDQELGDGAVLELRTCTCGSTVSVSSMKLIDAAN